MYMYLLSIIAFIVVSCGSQYAAEYPEVINLTHVPTDVLPTSTPLPTPQISTPTQLPYRYREFSYQPFEHGFMLWDIADHCAYAYREGDEAGIIIPDSLDKEYTLGNLYTYCLPAPEIPRATHEPNIIDNQIPIDENLSVIWQSYSEVRDGLGYAIRESEKYIGYVPYEGTAVSIRCCNDAVLPDKRILFCGHYGHSSGWCELVGTGNDG